MLRLQPYSLGNKYIRITLRGGRSGKAQSDPTSVQDIAKGSIRSGRSEREKKKEGEKRKRERGEGNKDGRKGGKKEMKKGGGGKR